MGWMTAFRYGVGEEESLERLCRWHRELAITRYSYYALIVLVVVIAALIARHLLRRRRARKDASGRG